MAGSILHLYLTFDSKFVQMHTLIMCEIYLLWWQKEGGIYSRAPLPLPGTYGRSKGMEEECRKSRLCSWLMYILERPDPRGLQRDVVYLC